LTASGRRCHDRDAIVTGNGTDGHYLAAPKNTREVLLGPSPAPRRDETAALESPGAEAAAAHGGGPLAGIRVLAVEQYGAGPFGTLFLADLGAEVVKIEDRSAGGDVSRYIPPGQAGTDSLFFEAFNRNKRSLALDLKNPAGRGVFERLVGEADIGGLRLGAGLHHSGDGGHGGILRPGGGSND